MRAEVSRIERFEHVRERFCLNVVVVTLPRVVRRNLLALDYVEQLRGRVRRRSGQHVERVPFVALPVRMHGTRRHTCPEDLKSMPGYFFSEPTRSIPAGFSM